MVSRAVSCPFLNLDTNWNTSMIFYIKVEEAIMKYNGSVNIKAMYKQEDH